ncbi:hypothetical protein K402DRAFT_415230 [Aulographum hederae CBS 113979]|uniref:Maintenance of telomere capping protein 1 n=1 Tax=Aulographum hederae CBS 113979 TaxID=1176131 RepID=A0A6G1GMC5_9PEZI|nr:hypothetical protein K402DRAFT_415230 [Aulographum hederae CBS 113979]
MAQKKAPTDEELSQMFEGLDDAPSTTTPQASKASKPSKPSKATPAAEEDDPLAELENLAKAKPSSRPNTPKLAAGASNRSRANPAEAVTPSSTGSARTSEDRTVNSNAPRKSGESTRSYHQSYTPASTSEDADSGEEKLKVPEPASEKPAPAAASGGGWWGGILSTASAAVKQAEAAVKEIQKNEDAKRWTEQVRGNVGALRGFGDELRTRALPTFTSLLQTIAPPISQHERLQIHTTHDLINYPSLDPLIYHTFSRVMAQVEGGDLMVIQRGSESRRNNDTDSADGFTGGSIGSTHGWSDGPWWRDVSVKRDLGSVKGLVEGTKLARASAEAYASEYFSPRGGLEEAAKQATQVLSETNPVRSSDIFLAIQPLAYTQPTDLFGGAKQVSAAGVEEVVEADELTAFAIYLHDPIHSITFTALSQPFPTQWALWLDAAPHEPESENAAPQMPAEIRDIVEAGGVDPREWIAEWIEEVIGLAVGVVAQRYVARRMGVGEGGPGRGKGVDLLVRREENVEVGAGEVARAL